MRNAENILNFFGYFTQRRAEAILSCLFYCMQREPKTSFWFPIARSEHVLTLLSYKVQRGENFDFAFLVCGAQNSKGVVLACAGKYIDFFLQLGSPTGA